MGELLLSIGVAYYWLLDFQASLEYFKQSLEISRQYLPSSYSSVLTVMYNLGESYLRLRKYEESLAQFREILEINKRFEPSNRYLIPETLDNISMLYDGKGKYEDSMKMYVKSVEMQLDEQNDDVDDNEKSIRRSNAYYRIGMKYRQLKNYEKALVYFEKSVDVIKHNEPCDYKMLENVLYAIRVTHELEGNYEQALDYYNQSLEMNEKTTNQQSLEYHQNTSFLSFIVARLKPKCCGF